MTTKEIAEQIQIQGDEFKFHYDAKNETFEMVSDYDDEYCLSAEEAEDRGLIALPSEYEIDEYKMMEEFASSCTDEIADGLFDVLHGKGAFRRFKDKVLTLGIEESWYGHRDKAYMQVAQRWASDNQVALED